MLDRLDTDTPKMQVNLHLPVEVATAMKLHCLDKMTHSKYIADLIEKDLKPRPSDDPKTQFRDNWD